MVIEEAERMKKEEPILVAIHCLVYNHEPYLRDCFEGFVMQKTNFRFVAIVHEDCSTDHSADIIREYEAKYPDIFRPIYETENQWHKTDGSLGRIMNAAINATGAKYVAMCEGDDYWTDPYKLQKQVDYMEAHPDYSMCFHRVNCLIHATGELLDEIIVQDMPKESTILDLAQGNYIHTPSVLFRQNKEVRDKLKSLGTCMPGDYVMWMLLAEKGKIWKMEEPMAVYRVGSGVWSTSHSIKNDMMYLCTLNKLYTIIENQEAKEYLQKQIDCILNSVVDLNNSYKHIMQSKAYRIGKALLKPFGWLKE